MTTFDTLAEAYQAGRTGYSTELYNAIAGYGLNPRHAVLDVACGTGLASRPLIENAVRLTGVDSSEPMLERARERFGSATWVHGRAEKLPFEAASFDAAICAQAIHHLDRSAAIAEMIRVVRPGGILAIWWKELGGEDPVKMTRDAVAIELGVEPIPSGLAGGFKEFYAAPLADHTLRVLPWHASSGLEEYLVYERSRKAVHDRFGDRAERYFELLEQRLREKHGTGNPILPLNYMQFLYLGRTAA